MGFIPSSFPPIADAGRLRTEAENFKTKADRVEDLATDSFSSWSAMPGVYEAPEASIVYSAFAPVKSSGQDLADDAATLKSAIDTYADDAESIKSRYDSLLVRWRSVEAQKASDDEWQEDEELVKEDNDILSDANALLAEYMAAQRACANKISGIYGGPTYVPTTQEGASRGEVQFGFTGEQLDAAAAEGKLPWGEPSEYDAPWWEDGWNVVASFGKGVWSGVTGTVTGLWNMVNVTDWDTFTTTWKGIGTLAVDTAIITSPVLATAVGPERTKEAGQRLLAVGKAAIHWDEWQEDPAYAAGATTFDLAAILATAGAGAVTKTGSMASKIATVAGGTSKAGAAVKISGLGAAARTTVKVADLAGDLKIRSLDLSTSVTQKSLGKLAPLASRLDDGLNGMHGPSPAYAGIGSPGSRPFSEAVDAGISRMEAHSNGAGSGTPAGGTAGPDANSLHGGDTSTTAPEAESGAPGGGNPNGDAPDSGNSSTAGPTADALDGSVSDPAEVGSSDTGTADGTPDQGAADGAADKDGPDGGSDKDAPDDGQRNYADVDGQRVDPAYEHPEAQHGEPVDDAVKDAESHDRYGSYNPNGPNGPLEGGARYPESIHPDLESIVDPDQPKYGVDEHGDPLTEDEYANRYGVVKPDSGLVEWDNYPDNAGAVEGTIRRYGSMDDLQADFPGLELDRIGANTGGYFAVEGTPWHMRSLPVNTLGKELHHFDLRELPEGIEVKVSEVAPAFGRPGGGTQLQFIDTSDGGNVLNANQLIRSGILHEPGANARQ